MKFWRKARVITLVQMCENMTGNNSNLDLVYINAYTRPPGGVCAPLIPENNALTSPNP